MNQLANFTEQNFLEKNIVVQAIQEIPRLLWDHSDIYHIQQSQPQNPALGQFVNEPNSLFLSLHLIIIQLC
jgi:hypothetical protein